MAKPITGKSHVGERREKRPNGDIYVYERITNKTRTQKLGSKGTPLPAVRIQYMRRTRSDRSDDSDTFSAAPSPPDL